MHDEEILSKFVKKEQRRHTPFNEEVSPHKRAVGTIGLELELEGNRIPYGDHVPDLYGANTRCYWKNIKDGSLRNGGREFVISRPCVEDEVKPLLEGLFHYLREEGAEVKNSNRCSTHVHINVAGYKIHEISAIISLWYIFEDALINWWDERRKSNHFCLALRDTKTTYEVWNTFVKTGAKPALVDGLKYSAMNIIPIWTQGSIEFRCGDGVDNPEQPAMWAIFLNTMVKYAVDHFSNPSDLAQSASEINPEGIFYSICDREELREFAQQVMQKNPYFNENCMDSLRSIQGLLLGHNWEDIIEKASRVKIANPFGARKEPKGFHFREMPIAPLRRLDELAAGLNAPPPHEPEEDEEEQEEEEDEE